MKIVILDGSAANPGDITWGALEDLGEVTAYDTTSKEQLIERMQGAEAAITNKTVFDRDAFEKLPDLKYIGVLATGYNVVDLEARWPALRIRHGRRMVQMPSVLLFQVTADRACRQDSSHNRPGKDRPESSPDGFSLRHVCNGHSSQEVPYRNTCRGRLLHRKMP